MKAVWLVDDNPLVTSVYGAALRAAGYEVTVFADGDAACAGLAQSAPDLVLLDLHIPNIPGLEVLRRLHAGPATRAVPVIVLSSANSDRMRQDALARGATQVLTKATCTPRQVVAVVTEVLTEIERGGPETKETVK